MKKITTLLFFTLLVHFSAFAQTQSQFDKMLSKINEDSIRKTMQDLQNFSNRFCAHSVEGNRPVAGYLVQRLRNYGIANAVIDSFHYEGYSGWVGAINRNFYNVKGRIEGSSRRDTTYIIGAHLDAIAYDFNSWPFLTATAPGADDNASGCAVMIEIARIFHLYNITPKYHIEFMAWDAEELGLLGAAYDAHRRGLNNEWNVFVLNNDMVATQPKDLPYTLNLHWYDNSIFLRDKAAEICLRYTSITPYIPEGIENDMRERSDSWVYNQYGYQGIFHIEHYFSEVYHSENDILDMCNVDFTKEVAKLNFAMLYHYNVTDIFDLDDSPAELTVSVYPIPVVNKLFIASFNDQLLIEKVELFDIQGRLLNSLTVSFDEIVELPMHEVQKGFYIVRIVTNRKIFTRKVIKQ